MSRPRSTPRHESREHRSLLAALRQRGYRITPQRQLIVDMVERASGHISVEHVYQEVSRQFPHVNLSTVYRTLDLLEELGILTHAHLVDGSRSYHHIAEAHHVHLVCHGCDHTLQVDDLDVASDFVARLRERYGFVADPTHFAIAGFCATCAMRAGSA